MTGASAKIPELFHARPLRAVDRILRLDREAIITEKDIRAEEGYFRGHYPDYPVYPGIFTVEAADQAARIYAATFLGAVTLVEARTRFLSALRPGDVLRCVCEAAFPEEGRVRIRASCFNGEAKAAQIQLFYQRSGRENDPA